MRTTNDPIFENLSDFILYCNELIDEDKINHNQNYNAWFNIIKSFPGDLNDLLTSYSTMIELYYHWLRIAIKFEDYEDAAIIDDCIHIEETNYTKLGKDLFNTDIRKQIIEINKLKIKNNK